MSAQLRSLLHALSDDETRVAATADATEIGDRLRAQVRHRRARRYAGVGTAVAAVAVGVLAVSSLGTPAPTEPAQPTPSTTVTAPTPTSAERAPLGPVTVHPDLPAAEPLAAGDLESSTDEWRVALVEPAAGVTDPAPTVLYLLGPQGQRFEVPTPVAWDGRLLRDWLPGTPLVLVAASDGAPELPQPESPWQVLDVLTGEVVSTVAPEPPAAGADAGTRTVQFVGDGTRDLLVLGADATDTRGMSLHSAQRRTLDGAVVTQMEPVAIVGDLFGGPYVSPDSAWLLLGAGPTVHARSTRDLTAEAPVTQPRPDSPGSCTVASWLDGSDLVMLCVPSGDWRERDDHSNAGRVETWVVPVAGGTPTLIGTGAWTTAQWRVGDQVYGTVLDTTGPAWAELVRFGADGTLKPSELGVEPGATFGARGGRLWFGLDRDDDVLDLAAIDPATGESMVLWPDLHAHGRVSVLMVD